jgi:hypothetical protein
LACVARSECDAMRFKRERLRLTASGWQSVEPRAAHVKRVVDSKNCCCL